MQLVFISDRNATNVTNGYCKCTAASLCSRIRQPFVHPSSDQAGTKECFSKTKTSANNHTSIHDDDVFRFDFRS